MHQGVIGKYMNKKAREINLWLILFNIFSVNIFSTLFFYHIIKATISTFRANSTCLLYFQSIYTNYDALELFYCTWHFSSNPHILTSCNLTYPIICNIGDISRSTLTHELQLCPVFYILFGISNPRIPMSRDFDNQTLIWKEKSFNPHTPTSCDKIKGYNYKYVDLSIRTHA